MGGTRRRNTSWRLTWWLSHADSIRWVPIQLWCFKTPEWTWRTQWCFKTPDWTWRTQCLLSLFSSVKLKNTDTDVLDTARSPREQFLAGVRPDSLKEYSFCLIAHHFLNPNCVQVEVNSNELLRYSGGPAVNGCFFPCVIALEVCVYIFLCDARPKGHNDMSVLRYYFCSVMCYSWLKSVIISVFYYCSPINTASIIADTINKRCKLGGGLDGGCPTQPATGTLVDTTRFCFHYTGHHFNH